MTTKKLPAVDLAVAVFPSELGWMAARGLGGVLWDLRFGYPTPEAAIAALGYPLEWSGEPTDWNPRLREQLQAYSQGQRVDFRWVKVVGESVSPFRRRVLEICRGIPYGKTLTYGQIASQAGSPGASRAVGAAMASNRVPLVIPCHRVVASNGGLGGFSAPGGIQLKRTLLELEARGTAAMLQVG